MTKAIRHPFKELRFTGGRFEQNKGWLDFDVLPELQVYRKLLVETAKEEWKRRNPGRERLPKGFEENIRLGFHEIREGSCAVPVERIVEVGDDALELYVPDEVDEAARIIDATLMAVREDAPFPDRLPAPESSPCSRTGVGHLLLTRESCWMGIMVIARDSTRPSENEF